MIRSVIRGSILLLALCALSCHYADEAADSWEEEVAEPDWRPLEPVGGEPLDDAEIEQLLGRLPDLEADEDDEVAFKRRDESLPPPRTGRDIKGQWPVDDGEPAAAPVRDGELTVQAFRPSGQVEPPFEIAVVFDRPVVELGAVESQSTEMFDLSPDVSGKWQWLGTQSATFVPDDDWAMATEFEVVVSDGVKAVDGTKLEEAASFGFTTPAPEVQAIYPDDPSSRFYSPYPWNWESPEYNRADAEPDTPVAVVFNQPVDVASAEAVTVRQKESEEPIPMDLVAGDEAERLADEEPFEEAYREGRVLVLSPTENYREDSQVVVEVEGPIKSEEGPVVGMADESHTFEVQQEFGAFELRSISCRIKGRPCAPADGLWLDFTNPIDAENSDIEVHIEPEVDDLHVRRDWFYLKDVVDEDGRWAYEKQRRIQAIRIDGDFAPRTDYTITVSGDFYDVSGQQLEQREVTGQIGFGDHRAGIGLPDESFSIRPADAEPQIPVAVREMESVKVRIFDVSAEDWTEFQRLRKLRERTVDLTPVEEKRIRIPEHQRSDYREIPVDYSAALNRGGHGQVMMIFEEAEPFTPRTPWQKARWIYWVQHTDLGVQLSSDNREMTTRVTSLSDGSFVDGAAVKVAGEERAQTDEYGAARFSVPTDGEKTEPVVIEHGGDTLLIPANARPYWPGGYVHYRFSTSDRWISWSYAPVQTNLLWYVVDDRQIYRPGETAHLRGWIRSRQNTPRSEPVLANAHQTVQYRVVEPQGNEIAEGEVSIDDFGGFEFDFEVPDEANLGTARIRLKTESDGEEHRHTHTVRFDEFRRPEYEVDLQTDAAEYMAGDEIRWEAKATYYAGGAVTEAPTDWRFTHSSAGFRPAGWSGWSFGGRYMLPDTAGGHGDTASLPAVTADEDRPKKTDESGRDYREIHAMSIDGFASRITGRVSVTDVNRQQWTATESVLVHPASTYVGLRSERRFLSGGDAFELEAVAVDHEGELVADRPVEMTLYHRQFGKDDQTEVDDCRRTSAPEPVECSFSELEPGRYHVIAEVEDSDGRRARSVTTAWVFGGQVWTSSDDAEGELRLRPERDRFEVGDTVRVAVQAPYYPLKAAVDLRRDGLYERREVVITEDEPFVEFDVEEGMIPNAHLRVSAIGDGEAYQPDRYASGSVRIDIERDTRRLDVDVTPADDQLAWQDDAEVDVVVTDRSGDPVENAQVLLYAVDESVLALTGYEIPDPLRAMYPDRSSGMSDIWSHQWLMWPEDFGFIMRNKPIRFAGTAGLGLAGSAAGAGAGMGAGSASAERGDAGGGDIEPREVFDALAFYRSDLVTDAEGRVSVTEQMPDNMTRYRVMAVAVEGERHFGTGEADVTVNRPLMVRPSTPRFLNVGDRFDLPVVVHNRTDEATTVDLAMRASSGLEWIESPGRRVEVPADERVEVRVAARATSAGTARVQIAIANEALSDAVTTSIPVLTPATTETFATYGSIGADDEDVALQQLRVPSGVYREYGGLEVTTSSTQLQALTDAFVYLVDYPFYCSEQLASRILSVLALHDVLEAFDAEGLPEPDELEASMQDWISRTVEMQHANGGFGFWPQSIVTNPFVTAHATLALWKAQRVGYRVPSRVIQNASEYLETVAGRLDGYSPRARATVEAYALHVRDRTGEVERRDLDALIGRYGIEKLSLEALGWLLPIAEGTRFERRFLERMTNQVRETAATAEFQETYERGADRLLHTTRRTDGVVLNGLLRVQPDHYLIEKVARGLLGHRSRGRWSNTQENVFILKALRSYFDTYEEVEPDFVARAWLGEHQIGEHGFRGRTTDRHTSRVPMSHLRGTNGADPVIVQRDGAGRMYYRIGLNYAPTARQVSPLNRGFEVERTYEAIDDPGDVRRTDDGWEIRAGARVKVELTMTIPARRYHVALVDWLPAGLEPVNPELEVSDVETGLTEASSETHAQSRWWWRSHWFEHQNLRDERVEAFSSLVHGGEHTYSYVARATTPGEFIAMPTKAEEMYHPETFGRTATEVVRVVEEPGVPDGHPGPRMPR